MYRRTRRSQAGFTLTEVMVAFGILTVGGLSSLHMLGVMSKSNGHVSAETDALALASRIASEIENAPYLPTAPDVGLAPGIYTAPVAGSAITTVGDFNVDGSGPAGAGAVAGVLNVSYEVVPFTAAFGSGAPGGVDVLITVDNPTVRTRETHSRELGRLMRPVRIAIRKDFSASTNVAVGGVVRW